MVEDGENADRDGDEFESDDEEEEDENAEDDVNYVDGMSSQKDLRPKCHR